MEFINDDDICRRQWRKGKRQKDRGEPGAYPLEGVIIQLVNTRERKDKTSQLTQRTKWWSGGMSSHKVESRLLFL